MAEKYISAESVKSTISELPLLGFIKEAWCSIVDDIPAADVRSVVLCGVCELHGHCYTEDVFAFVRLAEENRFCAVGKVKTNGEKREES